MKGKPLTHATSPALPDVWVGECIGRSTASCRTQLLGRSVLWTESPQETPGICSPFTDALPPVLTPVDGCCSSGSLTRSPHRGRTALSIECPFRTRAAQAESTRQGSCRPLPTPRIYTPGDRPKGRSLTPAAAPFPYLSRKDLEMGLALCIFVVLVVTRCGFPRGKPALRPLPGPSGHLAFHSPRSRKGGTDAAQRRSVPAEKKTGSPLRARTFFRRLPPGQRHEKR